MYTFYTFWLNLFLFWCFCKCNFFLNFFLYCSLQVYKNAIDLKNIDLVFCNLLNSFSLSFFQIPFKIMRGHEHIVSSCNFCVDDTKALSGSYDGTVKLWVGGPVLGGAKTSRKLMPPLMRFPQYWVPRHSRIPKIWRSLPEQSARRSSKMKAHSSVKSLREMKLVWLLSACWLRNSGSRDGDHWTGARQLLLEAVPEGLWAVSSLWDAFSLGIFSSIHRDGKSRPGLSQEDKKVAKPGTCPWRVIGRGRTESRSVL